MSSTIGPFELREETYWEKTARTRWGRYISEIERQEILKASNLAKVGLINNALEIGSEGGRWAKMLADLGWNMICTDIYAENLEICQKKIPQAKCILVAEDDRTFPCETSSIGMLLCIEVFPVITIDWFITEAFRVLRRGGLVVGVFQNKRSYRAYLHNLLRSPGSVDDYYVVAYTEWRDKLRKQGFKLINEIGFCWAPLSRESNSFLVSIFTYMEQILGLRRLSSISPWIIFIAQKDFGTKN